MSGGELFGDRFWVDIVVETDEGDRGALHHSGSSLGSSFVAPSMEVSGQLVGDGHGDDEGRQGSAASHEEQEPGVHVTGFSAAPSTTTTTTSRRSGVSSCSIRSGSIDDEGLDLDLSDEDEAGDGDDDDDYEFDLLHPSEDSGSPAPSVGVSISTSASVVDHGDDNDNDDEDEYTFVDSE